MAEARCSVVHVDLLGHIDALAGKRINSEQRQQILQQGSFIGGLEVKAFCQQRSLLSLRRVGVGEHARINDQTLHLLCRKDAVHDWDVLSWSVGRGFDQQNAWGEVSAFLARPVGIAQCKAERAREGWKEHG